MMNLPTTYSFIFASAFVIFVMMSDNSCSSFWMVEGWAPLPPPPSSSSSNRSNAKTTSSSARHRHRQQQQQQRTAFEMSMSPTIYASEDKTTTTTTTTRTRTRRRRKMTSSMRTSPPGLTRQEEIEYSFRIRALRAAAGLREQRRGSSGGGQSSHVTESEWAKACGLSSVQDLRKIVDDGKAARETLVDANAGLVTSIARKYFNSLKHAMEAGNGVGTILTLNDLVQEGNLGLMEATERFEPEKGTRFSTYATWWIRQRILRAISDSSRIIRLPVHVHTKLQKISKARTKMQMMIGREPSGPELAHELEMSVEQLQKYTDSSRNVVSLELPLRTSSSKEDRRTIGDVLASDAPTPEEHMETNFLKLDIKSVLEMELVDRERHVLVRRFGLDDGKPRSVEDTAKELGITRDRVRSVEARALNKLRSPQRNYRLKEYVLGGSNDANGMLETTATIPPTTTVFGDGQVPMAGASDRMWFF